jgi:hypothetical protein
MTDKVDAHGPFYALSGGEVATLSLGRVSRDAGHRQLVLERGQWRCPTALEADVHFVFFVPEQVASTAGAFVIEDLW